MRKSTGDVSTYTILVRAIDAYCDRVGIERPRFDKERAELIGVPPVKVSRFRNGNTRISSMLARSISEMLCADDASRIVLETQLLRPIVTAPDGSLCPPEIAFVRKFGGAGAVLMVEISDVWPGEYGLETPTSPMSLAFREGMNAGMNVVLFVGHRMRPGRHVIDQSLGDGYHEIAAKGVLASLQRMDHERVALYYLVENPWSGPRTGIRLTGFFPREAPETRWWIANRPGPWHFIPTSSYPEKLLDLLINYREILSGGSLPSQEQLEEVWRRTRQARGYSQGPCPIQRWTE